MSGSTIGELRPVVELFLLKNGISPEFYESEYNKYFEELSFENKSLEEFKPELIYIHTTSKNIQYFPEVQDDEKEIEKKLDKEVQKIRNLVTKAYQSYQCPILINNFDLLLNRSMGNLGASDKRGADWFIRELNQKLAQLVRERDYLFLNDINYISSYLGLNNWFDSSKWYAYKYAMSFEAIPMLAKNISAVISSLWGKTKKCLVLDLDNTTWGGVIGDDGVDGIKIGQGDPIGEAHEDLQKYALKLKDRGIALAVCSKNEDENAREGFSNSQNRLSLDDFVSFQANWDHKSHNLRKIAKEINIGEDALVFIDDNPTERKLVQTELESVSVPDIGSEVVDFLNILDKEMYFEVPFITHDDLSRVKNLKDNKIRVGLEENFTDYGEFLKSLNMNATIKVFEESKVPRITQLINKTNQFNLTTTRMTEDEVKEISSNKDAIGLYGELEDQFGDNGLITVLIGSVNNKELIITNWLMSCRVIKRNMEHAMLDVLIAKAKDLGITNLKGKYIETKKNALVKDHYRNLGFKLTSDSTWELDITENIELKNKYIEVKSE